MKYDPKKSESPALKIARKTLTLMTERDVDPTPVNFAVWYHYVAGDISDLTNEINKFLSSKSLHISDDVNIYLYNKYVLPPEDKTQEMAIDASQNAQTLWGEIMGAIENF